MKKSFLLYTDVHDNLKMLSQEEKGNLFDAIFFYVNNKPLPKLSPITEIAFAFIKQTIDRDTEKYFNICQKNKENIEKRWNKKEEVKLKKDTTLYDPIRPDTKHTDSDSDSDTDIDNDKEKLHIEEKIPNRLVFTKGQRIAFVKEYRGITTTEIEEQRLKCNAYMNMSSSNYTNPGLFFKGWLKRYATEKRAKEEREKPTENLPEISEEQRLKNIKRIEEIRKTLIKGVS